MFIDWMKFPSHEKRQKHVLQSRHHQHGKVSRKMEEASQANGIYFVQTHRINMFMLKTGKPKWNLDTSYSRLRKRRTWMEWASTCTLTVMEDNGAALSS